MANRYWNPAADANWADANVWATTYNGDPTGVATPTQNDDCFFTATNSHKCTISATANCNNLYFDNADNGGLGDWVGTLTQTGGNALNIYGSLAFSSGMTNSSATITFRATSGTNTIKCNTKHFYVYGVTFNGAGGTFQLLDDLETWGNFVLTAGTFDPNGHGVKILTEGIVNAIQGSPTFYNLTINDTSIGNGLTLNNNIIVTNNLTIAGTGAGNTRHFISSNTVGTPRTITCTGASVNYSNTDFQDITIVNGTLGTNSSVGDCGGNTGITFTGTADQHWVGTIANSGTGTWSTAANWTSRVPLPQDNVYMDKAFGTSCTVSADMPRLGKSIDWTGATWTTGLTYTDSTTSSMFGSLTLISGLTYSNVGSVLTLAGRGNYTITGNTVTISQSITINAPTGTYTLGGNLLMLTSRTLTITNGTFTCINGGNNYILNISGIALQPNGTLTLGSAIHLLNNAGTPFNNTGGIITSFTGTLKFTDSTNSGITFAGAGATYNNIYFSRGASTGSITITGSNTFNDFKDDGTAAHSLLFTKSTTNHIATWNVNGAGGGVRTILDTADGAGTFTLNGTGTTLSCDWLDIRRSTVDVSPKWYAGANSLNTASNTNWIFTAPPTYTLTYTAGANGSLTGNATQTGIVYGGSGTAITAVPNTDFAFSKWSDNSVQNPRTDTNVTQNITVSASFVAVPVTSKNAKKDENGRPTIICAYDGDGQTIIQIQAHPTKHALEVDDNTIGSDNGNNGGNAMLDENSVPVWMAESSDGSGNLIEVYGSAGKVLITSN